MYRGEMIVLLEIFVAPTGVRRALASPAAQKYRILKFVVGIFGLNSILT